MSKVEFFYDLSSPWTRVAFENIQPIIANANATIIWRPFLVAVYSMPSIKACMLRAQSRRPEISFEFSLAERMGETSQCADEFPKRTPSG